MSYREENAPKFWQNLLSALMLGGAFWLLIWLAGMGIDPMR